MFFRSQLKTIAKASAISAQQTRESGSAITSEDVKLPSSSSGLISYIAIVLVATLIASIIAIYGDEDAAAQKTTDLDEPVVTVTHSA